MRNHRNPRKRFENYTIDDLLSLSRGRWVEILTAAGIPSDALDDDRRGRPCPRCGGRDRFAPMRELSERGVLLCRHCFNRGTDPRPGDGLSSLRWWLSCSVADACQWLSGWLGVDPGYQAPMMCRPVERRLTIPDRAHDSKRFELMADVWRRNMRPEWLRRAAELLGLPVDTLARLSVGWSVESRATSWPMRDADGRVIGVRLRCPKSARKWAVRGSRAGLFYDPDLLLIERPSRLWIVEGPTDAAALLSIGLNVVGVPSAGGGADLLDALARRLRPESVVILADADGPGLAGAERLADALMIVVPVRVICPDGVKDARAWIVGGVDRSTVEGVADAAPVRQIKFAGVSHD